MVIEMQESFFNNNNPDKRVALENKALRERCQNILMDASKSPHLTDEMKENMFKVRWI